MQGYADALLLAIYDMVVVELAYFVKLHEEVAENEKL